MSTQGALQTWAIVSHWSAIGGPRISRAVSVIPLAQALTLLVPKNSRVSIAALTTGESGQQSDSSHHEPAASHQERPVRLVTGFAGVRLLEFQSKSRRKWSPYHSGETDPLHALVAASRLELDHVVTWRWLRQPNRGSASPSGAYQRGRLCPPASKIEARPLITAQTKPGEPTQACTNAELSLLKTTVEGCGRPHTPATAEVNHGELLPPKTSGGHEPDERHDAEAASHGDVQVFALKQEDVSDGHHWNILSGNQGEVEVINQPGHQLMARWWSAQEAFHRICAAKLEELTGHVREHHQPSDGRIQLTPLQSRGQLLIPSPLQTDKDFASYLAAYIPRICSPGIRSLDPAQEERTK